jgi:glycosyltransferase involved in cell wall biosynthesis
MRIDMFVYNRCTADTRVLKEARTLAEAGHRVRIVAVLDKTTPAAEERDGFRIVRIDRNPLHYRLLGAAQAAGQWWRRPLLATARRAGGGRGESAPGAARQGPAPWSAADVVRRLAWRAAGAAGRLTWRAWTVLSRPFKRAVRRLLLVPHKPLMFGDYYWRAYRLVRADPPDALHAHDLNTLPVAAALARRLRLPLTYDAHELYPEISTLSAREAATWRRIERRLAGRADHVLTVCDSIAGELERRYGLARPTVLLNCPAAGANGAVASTPAPAPGAFPVRWTGKSPESASGELGAHMARKSPTGAANGEPVVLYQGGFAPHRGLQTLVRAARELERGTIMLMGWGRLEDELRELIAAERLGERVRIVPPVPPAEVVARAAEATVGVIPYEPVGLNNTYTTPNKLFDYMAAGLPVVASHLPELIRFVEGAELGLTFEPGDPASLAATLNELLADPTRLQTMREHAQEAARRYTWERESRKLLALYDGRRFALKQV